MSMQAICPSCGQTNTMGRMFCIHCGAAMSAARPQAKEEVSVGHKLTAFLSRTIRLAVTLVLLYLIAMILWPLTPSGMGGDLQDVQRFQQKVRELKGGVLDGVSIARRVTEVELNAYLSSLLESGKPDAQPGAAGAHMSQVNLTLDRERVVVLVRSALGPVDLSYELTGLPKVDGRRFTFELSRARIGHLAVPGAARAWLAGRVAVVFSKMLDERSLLDQVDRLELGQGEVEVANVGR